MRRTLIILAFLLMACGSPASERQPHDTPAQVSETGAGSDKPPQNEERPAGLTKAGAATGSASRSPCVVQGADALSVLPLRAVGTEPFWSATVEGRCVTYATPEIQKGVRVWTKYSEEAGGTQVWTGALENRKFEMRVRPQPGCSDGMSDEWYPLAAELTAHGESLRGCAGLL